MSIKTSIIPYDSLLMQQAAINIRPLSAKSVVTGQFCMNLVPICREHCAKMAACGSIGHDGFNERAKKISTIIKSGFPGEIVAMTSRNQTDKEAAAEIMRLWKNSAGHWKILNSVCKFYCFSLARSKNVYYAIGIIVS